MITDHVEVTIDDLFIEHYDPPKVPPKISAALKGPRPTRGRAKRIVPHPKSLLGVGLLGALLAGAGLFLFKRFA